VEKYGKQGFEIIGVNGWNESHKTVENYVQKQGLKHKILLMGGAVARNQYGVRGYPTSFWVDHRGVVIDRKVGFRPSQVKDMERTIESLLAKKKSQ